jgi:hypothetical protein
MERNMELVISEAEKKRRKLFDELTRRGILPPRIAHTDLYAHATSSKFPFVGLPEGKRVPLRSKERFVQLRHRSVVKSMRHRSVMKSTG